MSQLDSHVVELQRNLWPPKNVVKEMNCIFSSLNLWYVFVTIALKIKTAKIKAPFEVNVTFSFSPHQKFKFSVKHHNTYLYYPSFCKADKQIHILLVSHLLSDKTALDVALET